MKIVNRTVACVLLVLMLLFNMRIEIYAEAVKNDALSVDNGYIKYTINKKTGGFSIRTLKGHPQKKYDDNMPLLYQEDGNSTETSFTTVRIDGEDYIFGQDYGWFNINSKLYDPQINMEEKTIVTKWVINNIEIVQKIAISSDADNDLAGNAGIAYEIKNLDSKEHQVGLRALLDSAIGSLDSPYMMAGYESLPTVTEREFIGEAVPDQIRGLDSLNNTSIMSYAILKGWSGGTVPDRVVVGHWGNLANTRYDYTPNTSVNFNNTSNNFRTADGALAFYWNQESLGPEEVRKAEFLYGIGNFSTQLTESNVNINMDVDRVYVTEDKSSYENEGIFEVRVEIDNTVDNAIDINKATLGITLEEGLSIVEESIGDTALIMADSTTIEHIPKGGTLNLYWRVKANPQTTITAKEISVSLYTNASTNAQTRRYVILPSVKGHVPDIQIERITPEKYFTSGDKNITISGNLQAFKSLSGKSGWDVYLEHTVSKESVKIDKSKVAFVGEDFNSMAISTNSELDVGMYEIVFKFIDSQLSEEFSDEIRLIQKVEVTNDSDFKANSYGIATVVRHNTRNYKIVVFHTEEELNAYKKQNDLNSDSCDEMEMLLEIKGAVRENIDDSGRIYYSVNPGESEVIINNIVQYSGSEPLIISRRDANVSVAGDGKLNVIDQMTFWNSGFDITFTDDLIHTLHSDKVSDTLAVAEVIIRYSGIGKVIQNIGGATIDLKYGVLTENWDGEEREGYAINFGGRLILTFLGGDDEDGDDEGVGGNEMFEQGTIGANIENILFGEKEDEVGFIGINASAQFSLPTDAFGSFIKNSPGMYAMIEVNTIEHIYAVEAGVKLVVFECTGRLQIKVIDINDVKVPIPDELYFSIAGDGGVPLVPPALFLNGLRGGYSDLADSISGDSMNTLPPLTLKLGVTLSVVQVLQGEVDMEVSLNGMSLAGKLTINKLEGINFEVGINAQWTDPWQVTLYGQISIFDIIKGGVSITVANDYFFGYGYLSVGIPDSIPIVGGFELAKVEAAISNQMIGMNIKVLSLTYGVVYYWSDGDVAFGEGIDLRARRSMASMYVEETPFGSKVNDSVAFYGTNVRRVNAERVESPSLRMRSFSSLNTVASFVTKNVTGADRADSLLFQIEYKGDIMPTVGNIQVKNPAGDSLLLKNDNSSNGGEEGNFLVQDLGESGKYIFISVTDNDNINISDGNWTVSSLAEGLNIEDFSVNIVDNIPEFDSVQVERDNVTDNKFNLKWTFDKDSAMLANGKVDVYLTDELDRINNNINSGTTDTGDLGILIGSFDAASGSDGVKVEIPDTLASKTYYAITVLSMDGCGPDIKTVDTPIVFNNANLPKPVKKVTALYGGNTSINAVIDDAEDYDYTYCNIFVENEQGEIVEDAYGIYYPGQGNIIVGGEKVLVPGQKYRLAVQTIRSTEDDEEAGKVYRGDTVVYSDYMTMSEPNIPKPVSITSNIDSNVKYSNNNRIKVEYNFDQEVNLKVFVNGIDIINSQEYKTTCEIDEVLEDGEYAITIEAVNKAGDIYSPNVSDESLNSREVIAYTVDTVIPSLKIGSTLIDSLETGDDGEFKPVAVSNQTVRVKDGKLKVEGITEPGAVLTLDGSTGGISLDSTGKFTIERSVNMDSEEKTMLLKVVDKAGNENSCNIYVINSDVSFIESLNIKRLTEEGQLTQIQEDKDGYKIIEIQTGETVDVGIIADYNTAQGIQEDVIANEKLSWYVLVGNNLMDFGNGKIYAKLPGEAIIKVQHSSSGFTLGSEGQQVSTEDVVRILIDGEPVYDLPHNEPSSRNSSLLSRLLNQFIDKIGKENLIKTLELYSGRQESVEVNSSLKLIVPIGSVDKQDILVLYRTKNYEELKSKIKGELLGDIMRLETIGGEDIKKPITLIYNYSDKNVSSKEKVSLYKFNEFYGRWEYVAGENNTSKKEITVQIDDFDSTYALLCNDSFTLFKDIGDNWARPYIYALSSLGIINGMEDGGHYVFMPDMEITRAEFIKLAVSSMKIDADSYENTELPFADKDKIAAWAEIYIKAAYANGWINGKNTAEGLIGSMSSNITREEAVTILHRIKEHKYASEAREFMDKDQISEYAHKAVKDFTAEGILNGYSNGEFRPKNSIKRGEASKVIYEWINQILK